MLQDGVNNVTATATNTAGQTTTDTVFITYKTPIMIYITLPYDGANLSVTPIDVEGLWSDPAATVEVNGINAISIRQWAVYCDRHFSCRRVKPDKLPMRRRVTATPVLILSM